MVGHVTDTPINHVEYRAKLLTMFAQADSTTTTEDSKEFFSSDSKGKIKETELSPLDNNVKIMKNEFAKKKRIIISGLDENCTPQVSGSPHLLPPKSHFSLRRT